MEEKMIAMNRLLAFSAALIVWMSAAIGSLAEAATTYTYDALDRLTLVTYGNCSSISYTYDPAGNITAVATSASTQLAGDLDTSGTVDLMDAVLGLKMIAGQLSENFNRCAGIDNGSRIGLREVIYIMQDTAGLRND